MSTLQKVRMHTITINVTFLQYSNTAFNDFEDEFVNRIREKILKILKKAIFFFFFWGGGGGVGSVLGGKVGARQTNIF